MSSSAKTRDEARQLTAQARERSGQLWVLWTLALVVLVAAIFRAGWSNIFLPGWWHIDLH